MANLVETEEYPAGIYQLETVDPVLGGPPNEATGAGMDNIPHQQLARRTRWLKARVDQLLGLAVGATTTVAGLVRLSNATNSTSETLAATPKAVKAAYDLAAAAVPKSTNIVPAGLVSGGGPLSDNVAVVVSDATRAEAEEGTISTKAMSPLRVAQAIDKRLNDRVLGSPITITVGLGGDVATIGEALARLSPIVPAISAGAIVATVRLLAGFQMAEQVFVRGINMGWVRIISDEPSIPIRRAFLSIAATVHEAGGSIVKYPAFCGLGGGVLPAIATKFVMTAEGASVDRVGIMLADASSAVVESGCGVESSGYEGALVMTGGVLSADGASFKGAAGIGVTATRNALASMRQADLSNCGSYGIICRRGAAADAEEAIVTGAGVRGVWVQSSGRLNINGANCRRGVSDAATDIAVTAGGLISAVGATGGTSITPNTVTASGIIHK